ncbi:MAG TPA: hypothetical protein VIG24_09095 [Acidimicrobiia bacterium]
MISISRLRARIVGDRVVFDRQGDPADVDVSNVRGHAILVVAPVTDAVKRVEEGRVESLDRDRMWAVEAIALDRVVVDQLDVNELSVEELLAAVPRMGYSWEISSNADL